MRGKRHLKELRRNCARADDLSRELLLKIVRDNRDTEYGRAHHFSAIKSIEDYKRLVPLSTCDDYAPCIEPDKPPDPAKCGEYLRILEKRRVRSTPCTRRASIRTRSRMPGFTSGR